MKTATTITLDQARHEANIATRAANLFTTLGYRYRAWDARPGTFTVFPADPAKPAYIVDTETETCQCKGFARSLTCAHLQACIAEAAIIAAVAAMEAAYNDSDEAAADAGVAAYRAAATVETCPACHTPREVNDNGVAYFTPCFECESRL